MSTSRNIPIPQTKDDVTIDWLNTVLEPEGLQVKGFTFLGDANGGRGYLSALERVHLEIMGEPEGRNVVLKSLPTDPNVRKYVIEAGFATREVQMYTKVFKDLEGFLISRGVSREKYLFRHPKCYYGKEEGAGETYVMILILEDLVSSEYKPWGEGIGKDLDWTHTAAVIREMALLHAVSTAYGIVNQVDNFLEIYPFLMDLSSKDDKVAGYVKTGFEVAFKVLAEEDTEPVPDGLLEKLSSWESKIPALIANRAVAKCRACIRHNDLHVGNIFFSYQRNSVSAAIFDFQASLNDAPMYDLCFFQLLCCEIKASSAQLSQSIQLYQDILGEAFREMKVDLAYSVDEMRAEFESTLVMSLMHIISGAPVWCFGPQSNKVSRLRLRRAIIDAYNRNLLEDAPTH